MPTKCQRWLLFVCTLSIALFSGSHALAQTKPKIKHIGLEQPKTLLYVGHSFFFWNNGIHRYVTGLSTAADPNNKDQYRPALITITNAGLKWHDVESYLRPGGVNSHFFTADGKVVFSQTDKPFDVVIMNDCSNCPTHPQLKDMFYEYAQKHCQTVIKHGAKPALFMNWGFANMPEMTFQLVEQYTIAGNNNDALVIPAGLAFARALNKNPQIALYDADKRHPSLLGTYLAACTIYASVYEKTPIGNPYNAGIDAKTLNFLQEVAWETVNEYFGK